MDHETFGLLRSERGGKKATVRILEALSLTLLSRSRLCNLDSSRQRDSDKPVSFENSLHILNAKHVLHTLYQTSKSFCDDSTVSDAGGLEWVRFAMMGSFQGEATFSLEGILGIRIGGKIWFPLSLNLHMRSDTSCGDHAHRRLWKAIRIQNCRVLVH